MRTILPLVCAVALACIGSPTPQDSASGTLADKTAQVSPRELIDSLVRVPGNFAEVNGQWQFDGDQSVFAAIAQRGDSLLRHLVDCLDRTEPASATVNGAPVLAGAMCGRALQRVAYPTEHEDGVGGWVGVVKPDASPRQLQMAKRAWMDVLATGRYKT